ncbi:uncharacterized protein F5Z01DRAFT_698229 [Emericellopsis atlantica]|uniref:Cyanovirin-N domain-containing protein n=1 Tax=Emericellopsis atlantica TaxID=2614577 RepID=A0A9P7ZR55_9HYPO|nr:uncharacterized protein F5Z01DRAFT_698229 [Emericellopsis atlantica]KAG9256312.1 hypothetical protein F5Z01DRAFT_698229 [Emericellopsis atlantica]
MLKTSAVAAGMFLFSGSATALFNCNDNQNAFPPTPGKFAVHYTSVRDTNTGKPWIRICTPSSVGDWDQSGVLELDCAAESNTFGTDQTGLNANFVVVNGNGCNSDSTNLSGASMSYDGEEYDLQNAGSECGDRDHGITCEWDV